MREDQVQSAPLSEREIEIVQLVASGLTNQEIARALVISPNTVKVHLRNIYEKLGAASRTEATMIAVREGWVTVPGTDGEPLATTSPQEATVISQQPTPVLQPLQLPAPQPIGRGRRIYLLTVFMLTLLLALVPALSRQPRAGPINAFSDQAVARIGPSPAVNAARWQLRAFMPTPRSRMALGLAGNQLYVIGGESIHGVTDAVDRYDPESNGWLPRARKPTAVSNIAAATIGDLIYVPGGTLHDGQVTNVLEVYDPATNSWRSLTAMPAPRTAAAVAAWEEKLFVFGGWDGNEYTSTIFVYDVATDAWRQVKDMPAARGFLSAATLGERIYLVGGFDGEQESASAFLYTPVLEDTGLDPWQFLPDMAAPRGGLAVVTEGTSIFAIGGGWTQPVSFHERYDPFTDTWASIPSPVEEQWRHLAAVALGPNIFAMGGWSGDYMAINAEYLASFRTFLPFGVRE